jgi:hypothetical protein
MRYIILEDRISDYPNPIILKKNQKVRIGQVYQSDKWKNWIRCYSEDNEGWVPEQIVRRTNDEFGIIMEDYSANELSVKKNDSIHLIRRMNGWILGYNDNKSEEIIEEKES